MTAVDLSAMGRYATVVVDPSWPVARDLDLRDAPNGAGYAPTGFKPDGWPYDLMPLSEIAMLPIAETLADDALVFCWTTRKFLPATFPIIEAWGLKYRLTMVWHKPDGPQMPNFPKLNGEFVIVGAKGNPKFASIKAFNVVNCWPRGGHSEKPEGFYELLRRVTIGPRLDVFGRRRIAGFDSWGNEAPEGPALPSHYQEVLL